MNRLLSCGLAAGEGSKFPRPMNNAVDAPPLNFEDDGQLSRSSYIMPPTAKSHPGSLALDQWRGLALVLVLVAHAFHESGRVDGLGRVGVNLFFFISGILVFRSLSGTKVTDAWGLTRSFWYRRMRRLYPALLAYVLILGAAFLVLPSLSPQRFEYGFSEFLPTLPSALFYYLNYLPNPAPVLGHIWSLACEMQFYLLAPLLFLAGGSSPARRNLVFGGLIVLLTGLGAAQPFVFNNPFDVVYKYHFEFSVWPMMAGFFFEYQKTRLTRLPTGLARLIFWLTLTGCATVLVLMALGFKVKVLVVMAGGLLLLPCWLAYAEHKPIPTRSGQALRWLGERTYSIYLWQQPLTICFFLPVAWWPLGSLLAIPIGALWFRWFEFPFLSASRQIKGNVT
jgi:peptidoglycan/LPS O-acetylase OafA/YrhL